MTGMKRQVARVTMAFLLVVTTTIAVAMWSRRYDGNPDPKALFEVESAKVSTDRSEYGVELHLKKKPGEEHDLSKPAELITTEGSAIGMADTTLSGNPEEGFTEVWLNYRLEPRQMEGRLALRINGGELVVKSSAGMPVLREGEPSVFRSPDWNRSWPGF